MLAQCRFENKRSLTGRHPRVMEYFHTCIGSSIVWKTYYIYIQIYESELCFENIIHYMHCRKKIKKKKSNFHNTGQKYKFSSSKESYGV